MRDDRNSSIPYSKSIAAIKATPIREEGIAHITVQKEKSVLKLMKEFNVTPYTIPDKKKTAQIEQSNRSERLTSEEEENHDDQSNPPPNSSDEGKFIHLI